MSSRFTLFPFTHTSFAFTLVTLPPIPCDFCGVCTKCVAYVFCQCERVCIGICVCECVCVCAGGTDSRLTLCWTLSMLWAGRVSEGSIENERGGLGSIRLPGRLSYCQMVRAGLIFGSQLLKLETVSVGRPVPQACAAGGHQTSGALERLSLKAFAYWENFL